MIQSVLFDLDNTLYNFDKAHAAAFRATAAYAAERLDLAEADFHTLYYWAMDEALVRSRAACAAIHNRLIRFQLILERLRLPLTHARPMEALYWNTLLDAMEPSPGIRDCFHTLRNQGLRIGIGTNMTADYQYDKLIRLDLLESVDFIVTSEEANAEKPDRLFYDCCLSKTGCPAAQCAFVGDNPEHDVMGAVQAGMHGVWFRPPYQESSDFDLPAGIPVIASMAELPGVLAALP